MSMSCPRCQAKVVIGEGGPTSSSLPPSLDSAGNIRLKMALVLAAGNHPEARREVFRALEEGIVLLPRRTPDHVLRADDCFHREGQRGLRALLVFTDQDELRAWGARGVAAFTPVGLKDLLALMAESGSRALIVNEASLLGLVLDVVHLQALAAGRDPNIRDLRDHVLARAPAMHA